MATDAKAKHATQGVGADMSMFAYLWDNTPFELKERKS